MTAGYQLLPKRFERPYAFLLDLGPILRTKAGDPVRLWQNVASERDHVGWLVELLFLKEAAIVDVGEYSGYEFVRGHRSSVTLLERMGVAA